MGVLLAPYSTSQEQYEQSAVLPESDVIRPNFPHSPPDPRSSDIHSLLRLESTTRWPQNRNDALFSHPINPVTEYRSLSPAEHRLSRGLPLDLLPSSTSNASVWFQSPEWVFESMPFAYWTGRYVALADRQCNEKVLLPSTEIETENEIAYNSKPRVSNVMLHMYAFCATVQAATSLRKWQVFYGSTQKPPLTLKKPPEEAIVQYRMELKSETIYPTEKIVPERKSKGVPIASTSRVPMSQRKMRHSCAAFIRGDDQTQSSNSGVYGFATPDRFAGDFPRPLI